MTLTVFILDHQRFQNIATSILPHLLIEPFVNQIIIAHSNYLYESYTNPLFPRLEANEIQVTSVGTKQLIRIQDTDLNDTYGCFRRWIWIRRLLETHRITNPYLLSHDDDFVFAPGEIDRLFTLWSASSAIGLCASGGRSFTPSYTFQPVNGPCPIAVGQSLFLRTSSILEAMDLVDMYHIPPEILQEDDIVISLLLSKGLSRHLGVSAIKKTLPSRLARWQRPNHTQIRTRVANWILSQVKDASSLTNCPPLKHSLATNDDTLMTL